MIFQVGEKSVQNWIRNKEIWAKAVNSLPAQLSWANMVEAQSTNSLIVYAILCLKNQRKRIKRR